MNLELFVTTVKEYNRFAKQLPLGDISKSTIDLLNETTYIAIQTRLMLLRKYASKGEKNNVYLENLIMEAKDRFPEKTTYLDKMRTRFFQINEQSFEQILSDGSKINLYQSIEDVIYGLYLHADKEKILRLSFTKDSLRFFYTRKYVEEFEAVVLEMFDFLIENNIQDIIEKNHAKAPVIHLGKSIESNQDIKQSPFWGNLYGHDATDDEINLLSQEFSDEEIQIFMYVRLFLDELTKETISVEALKSVVFWSTIEQWGDFTEAVSLYKNIPNPGISSKVRFNEKKDAAYVRIYPNVEGSFIISSPHVITGVYDITFIKDSTVNMWKIFAFGSPIDPIIRDCSDEDE